jgi:hypothetical protein
MSFGQAESADPTTIRDRWAKDCTSGRGNRLWRELPVDNKLLGDKSRMKMADRSLGVNISRIRITELRPHPGIDLFS